MRPQQGPSDSHAQLRWLVDRAEIGEVLTTFTWLLDTRDWSVLADLVTDAAEFQLDDRVVTRGREEFVRLSQDTLQSYSATWTAVAAPTITTAPPRRTSAFATPLQPHPEGDR